MDTSGLGTWGAKLGLLLLVGFTRVVGHADIIGQDDRKEALYQTHIQEESRAVAVSVLSSMIQPSKKGFYEVETDLISDLLCPDERFADQSSISYACTGFLVGPDLLVTAGHCATHFATQIRREPELYCEAYTWVFDYMQPARPWVTSETNVYKCKKILYAVYDGDADQRDFALIQLDRPVVGRAPLKLATSAQLKNDAVFMLGHPMGLPMKYADGAKVIDLLLPDSPSLMTDLDAFAGNSGSPVFNKNKEVIGVLVGGSPNVSTYTDKQARCDRYNRCDEDGKNCTQEDQLDFPRHFPAVFSEVQKISNYSEIIKTYQAPPLLML